MTVSGSKATTGVAQSSGGSASASANCPCPRMSTMMAIQKSTLYLYGGMIEKGEKQFTLSDMHSLGNYFLLAHYLIVFYVHLCIQNFH